MIDFGNRVLLNYSLNPEKLAFWIESRTRNSPKIWSDSSLFLKPSNMEDPWLKLLFLYSESPSYS